ncbi:cobalt-precorrin-5B (C(1))-methyltransferase [Breoghania sp. L-A4]|uniref:cobalt-precorrin-5B (C(1))-methyltransferase n=1 Tax=Breoghania sp. L-A4 TaxID=2304600 RepID=UPI000E35D18E|nr:cobalt-precorrin-5B (C(1))-methyltransferase [Breoghania sp. L-A4]AXS42383.1 cobalt-precorrin-5B (C(1))-methyltransferase [Breoghania sp. L-A4]
MNQAAPSELRRGWTTGACATAATKAAFEALLCGRFPDPVTITLPRGEQPSFALATEETGDGWCSAGIVKDAGDDPDVTHGALVSARVGLLPPGSGVVFKAGEGVGTVTKPGLPIPPGEPAINPVPRTMMTEVVAEVAQRLGARGDVEITISIADGARLAQKTMNPRLGILGGLSVLGTTGIVRPFSCAAWIASIHRGIDVARATGLTHVAGATGATSEAAVRAHHGLPEEALLDMGDFVGGTLKYLRQHPVARVTIAGGPGKITKLAQGHLDLHSKRGQVDLNALADLLRSNGADPRLVDLARGANTAKQVFDACEKASMPLGDIIAARALTTVRHVLRDAPIQADVLVIDRAGTPIGHAQEQTAENQTNE